MTRILATFPGKHGDLLWALPTVRAVSEAVGAPVDLAIAGAYRGLVSLLQQQPYLGQVEALESWVLQDTAPVTPRVPPADGAAATYDHVLHLGYEAWPQPYLPHDVWYRAIRLLRGTGIEMSTRVDEALRRPWITPPAHATRLPPQDYAVGFTEEHFELKVGLTTLLARRFRERQGTILSTGPRWQAEYWQGDPFGTSWETAAAWIRRSAVFVGCCSALHVLAVAIGTPAIVVEPNPHRRQDCFWPLGFDGPEVTLLRGNDGQATVDARHLADAIDAAVARRRVPEAAPLV